MSCSSRPRARIVIVGGGFGGLVAARALRAAPVRVTLIDRQNHHLFQPLLYQVATAALNPSDIASPIRRILRDQRNAEVLLEEATAIDVESKRVILLEGSPRVLTAYVEPLSKKARDQLVALGVDVRTGQMVTAIDEFGVSVGSDRIEARTVLWAAGVAASPLARSLDVPLDHAG